MTSADVEQLNKEFSFQHEGHSLCFKTGEGNIPVVEIKNKQASAVISLQGAHLLSWRPAGEEEVIWLSEDATFAAGRSVRGGIPVCWPWFGAHNTHSTYPAHGFARTVYWQVLNTQQLAGDETDITFRLDTSQLDVSMQQMWPQRSVVDYRMTIGKTLTLELTTFNYSDQPIVISEALHTYFKIDDVANAVVYGLEGKDYLDKTEGFARKLQTGPVTIDAEVDRVYLQTDDEVSVNDGKRNIVIQKQGSHSTVVWNPWIEIAAKMGDLGKDGYRHMLCVESANAADSTINIRAGESHQLRVTYALG